MGRSLSSIHNIDLPGVICVNFGKLKNSWIKPLYAIFRFIGTSYAHFLWNLQHVCGKCAYLSFFSTRLMNNDVCFMNILILISYMFIDSKTCMCNTCQVFRCSQVKWHWHSSQAISIQYSVQQKLNCLVCWRSLPFWWFSYRLCVHACGKTGWLERGSWYTDW